MPTCIFTLTFVLFVLGIFYLDVEIPYFRFW